MIESLLPTVAFLAALLLIADGCHRAGIFEWLGSRIATSSSGGPKQLMFAVFATVSISTALLNLDATVLILTPVVLVSVAYLGLESRPFSIATAHLSNSASLLLPVSNLTNLLVFEHSGLSFTRFMVLMLLPWIGAIMVEWFLLPRVLPVRPSTETADVPVSHIERMAKAPSPPGLWTTTILGLTLTGFVLSGVVGVEPIWFAWAGALLIAGQELLRHKATWIDLVKAIKPGFLVFVLALGIVAWLADRVGIDTVIADLMPTGDGLLALLAVAAISAVLANLINNLPATLILAPAVAGLGDGPLLAMLIGVGVGPNLTYLGSIANLLWRRVMADAGKAPSALQFTKAGIVTTPVALLVSTTLLWLSLKLFS